MTDIYYTMEVKKIIMDEFDLEAITKLRDDLNEIIEASKPKPKVHLWNVPKTRVDKTGTDPRWPWKCTGVPEDKRDTQYATWEKAMEWATMSSEKRIEKLEYEAQFEMGQ